LWETASLIDQLKSADYVISVITPWNASPVPCNCCLSLNSSEGRNSVAGVKSRNNIGEERLSFDSVTSPLQDSERRVLNGICTR